MSLAVRIRSAHATFQTCSVHIDCSSLISDLKRAICEQPHYMFRDPSRVVLVLKGDILADDSAIPFLRVLNGASITAVRVHHMSLLPSVCTGSSCVRPLQISPAPDAIARGVRVQIHGLKQKPELNGCSGVAFYPSHDGERWLVNIDSDMLIAKQALLRTSNLAAFPANKASDPTDPEYFDSLGITMPCILEFIERNGGQAAFDGLTTSQVKRRFVVPETQASKQSLCEQLRCNGDARVKEAQWFVSHAWQYKFLDVVSSLKSFFKSEPDGSSATLWFDVFSTSQHDTYSRPPLWWQRTFVNAIGRMGRLIMVVTPWLNPITLTRAWCILELFACCNSQSRFEIALPPDQHEAIFDTTSCSISDEYCSMLSKVKCEDSECSREEDRVRIFETVRALIGFLAMDRLIYDTLAGWLLTQLNTKKQLYYQQGKPALLRGFIMSRKITTLLNALGRHVDAEAEVRQALSFFGVLETDKSFDFEHWLSCIHPNEPARELVIEFMLDLAVTFNRQRRYLESGPLFQQILPMLGDSDFNLHTVGTLMNAALAFRGQKHFVEAERLLIRCLSAFTKLLGAEHIETIVCLNSLAITYRELGKFDAADAAFLKVIDIGKRTIGEHHYDTQAAMKGLANSYSAQKRYSEAEPLYVSVLECARRTLGFCHPETLDSLANLASFKGDLGAIQRDRSLFARALQLHNEAIEAGIQTLGAGHHLVLRWQNNFAADKMMFLAIFGESLGRP